MSASASSTHPLLTTDRLVLRPWGLGEVAAVSCCIPSVDWADGFPAEGDRIIAHLFEQHPEWLDDHSQRLIVERDSDLLVGSIGLFLPPDDGQVEIGYGIVESRRGRGYATEATRALTAYALTLPDVHTVVAGAELSNPASLRVLEKAGFRRLATDDEENLARFMITRPDRRER
ncbi:GNAT family N-acetyltransferase [Streptomyces rimosus]|uniref:GNAT family N-acetyltransferase n=1 Tax=Streptomyces rimosus TaxID=1927 RepID=UPI0004C6CE8D|nr:GNAT family N-acetyltransferase [Streptomyces rimosus]